MRCVKSNEAFHFNTHSFPAEIIVRCLYILSWYLAIVCFLHVVNVRGWIISASILQASFSLVCCSNLSNIINRKYEPFSLLSVHVNGIKRISHVKTIKQKSGVRPADFLILGVQPVVIATDGHHDDAFPSHILEGSGDRDGPTLTDQIGILIENWRKADILS